MWKRLTASFAPPERLSVVRALLALGTAIAVDMIQFSLGALGWIAVDQALDLFAFVVTTWLLGFHFILLPTAFIEFIPVADMLPTWTACVIIVLYRRRNQKPPPPTLPA